MSQSAAVRIFGIRHHGPGSARHLRAALEAWQPDALLVEGPCEATDLIPLVGRPDMQPPVALLVYVPDTPQQAVFYPFAVFSPEWQALDYGVAHQISTQFIDLPQQHWMALKPGEPRIAQESPLDQLARAAGITEGEADGETWWEQMFEDRSSGDQIFEAVMEAMSALRETPDRQANDPIEPLREAAMRQAIRQTQKQGTARIAVVCGAWHAPALASMPPARADADLLRGLPRVKVSVTWAPWSYGHLARASGYGAGVTSPGWYEHLWNTPEQTTIRWLSRVTQLLREQDMDASSAQVIDAVRLAESLAALRNRPRPGLNELNEAARAVLCLGDSLPLELVRRQLIVGDRLGQVAEGVSVTPLQQDLAATQKRLRLPPLADEHAYDLDLRQPNDLARSHLLHRLALLDISWGQMQRAGGQKGTFHERWTLRWQPALAIAVIEAAVWGHTVEQAATARATHLAAHADDLAAVTALLERVILAHLPEAIEPTTAALQERTARSGDVPGLMRALPPLARIARYGNVRMERRVEGSLALDIEQVIAGLAERIFIGLPLACASLDDEAARPMLERIEETHASLMLLQNPTLLDDWVAALTRLIDQNSLHGLLGGRGCRILYDQGALAQPDLARRLRLALSTAHPPACSAAWLEGLLRGSGLLLLHDQALWSALDEWVTSLPAETFAAILPLLRRACAFATAERRQIGERVQQGIGQSEHRPAGQMWADLDTRRADAALSVLAQLMGVKP